MILSVENGCFSYKNSKDKLLLEDINSVSYTHLIINNMSHFYIVFEE